MISRGTAGNDCTVHSAAYSPARAVITWTYPFLTKKAQHRVERRKPDGPSRSPSVFSQFS